MSRSLLVVGAPSAIARGFLKTYGQQFDKIFCQYRATPDLLVELGREQSVPLVPMQADLSNTDELNSFCERVASQTPSLTAVMFCAAPRLKFQHLAKTDWLQFQQHFDVQIRAPHEVIRRLLPLMGKEVSPTKVVFILSSVIIGTPPKNMVPYVVSKYAELGLMKALAAEYSNKNIRFNAVSPSMVETEFLREIPEKIIELSAASHPLKRNASLQDVLPILELLTSDACQYMNGTHIPVTGGQVMP